MEHGYPMVCHAILKRTIFMTDGPWLPNCLSYNSVMTLCITNGPKLPRFVSSLLILTIWINDGPWSCVSRSKWLVTWLCNKSWIWLPDHGHPGWSPVWLSAKVTIAVIVILLHSWSVILDWRLLAWNFSLLSSNLGALSQPLTSTVPVERKWNLSN